MRVSPRLKQIFLRVLQARYFFVGGFLLLTLAGIYGALHIPTDSSIDRLIVAGDPTAQATQAFEKVFPPTEQALILLEAPDPLDQDVLQGADALEHALDKIPHVGAHSLLTLFFRSSAPAVISADDAARVRTFAAGTSMFRRSSLLGDHYLGLGLDLRVTSSAERDAALAAIDALVLPLDAAGKPHAARPNAARSIQRGATGRFALARCVAGAPDRCIHQEIHAAVRRLPDGAGIRRVPFVAGARRHHHHARRGGRDRGGLGALLGFTNSVVSTLVPLTVMVTATATLVYIHSRYMQPDDILDPLEHHARALANKFLPCTASMFATAVGFAALAVSDIRPVREMGLWTACGLIVAWVACFTLFPALQSLLRTPRLTNASTEGRWFAALVDVLVPATRRHRWLLVSIAVLVMLCGAAALFGIPGKLEPLRLETDALTYVNPHERVADRHEALRGKQRLGCGRSLAAHPTRSRLGSRIPARRGSAEPQARGASRHRFRRWPHLSVALRPLHPVGHRSTAYGARRLAQTCRRSTANLVDGAERAQLRRHHQSCQCALEHTRPRRAVRTGRRHAPLRRTNLGRSAGRRTGISRGERRAGGPRCAVRQDHRAAAADAHAKLSRSRRASSSSPSWWCFAVPRRA
jgi:hypothetical protein